MNVKLFIFLTLIFSTALVGQISLDSLKDEGGKLLAGEKDVLKLPTGLTRDFNQLLGSFDLGQAGAMKSTQDALSALTNGKDIDALKLLDKVQSAGLKPEQINLLKDLKLGIDQYVLQRQFGSLPEFKGPLKKVTRSLKSGNPEKISSELNQLLKTTTPSKDQKSLLMTMLNQYQSWW